MKLFDKFIKFDIKKDMGITGVTDDFFAVGINNLYEEKNENILLVVNSLYEATNLFNSFSFITDKVLLFPMDDFLTSEAISISPDLKMTRLETINKLLSDDKYIVITNIMGYLRYLPTKNTYLDSFIEISVSDSIDMTKFIEKLNIMGYEKSTIVTKTGDYAVRGFIIDVFPIGSDNPVRFEFFGDEIDSIRNFDISTQKSIANINTTTILPVSEFIVKGQYDYNDSFNNKNLYKYGNVSSISDYLNGYTIFKDYNQLELSYLKIMEEAAIYRSEQDLNYTGNYMHGIRDINNNFVINYLSIDNISSSINNIINYKVKTIDKFNDNIDLISSFITKMIGLSKTVFICLKDYQLRNISNKLNNIFYDSDGVSYHANKVNLVSIPLASGFIYNDIVVLTENELFKVKTNFNKKYNTKFRYGTSIDDLSKLSIGDYVVHSAHGIGIYNGIKTLTMADISKDYLEILYAGEDKIYVPVEKIDTLVRYSGKDGYSPKINKLDSVDWKKTKARVKQKAADMADKLLKLYAEREKSKGFAFSKDDYLTKQFEERFSYQLTKDQINSINQIKADMESDKPMDRLLCGDVGFGKTEVAFNAAFKAINDDKQVLFLCPTTILSSQHYENAINRFADFPVNIGLLNRFTTPKDEKRILQGLADGTVNMVIGTHRLLSNDIHIKDLGLLIIDEEQRFGVSHKEKLKEMKSNVDVLTLSATPIPRTLQMSLTGIRSLSLIETPPVNRFPIQTYVVEENNQIIKDAIYKEMSRGGQVFVLYNRVETIELQRDKIASLVPNARIAIIHGKMNKDKLEKTLMDFINYKYDILICTTIIETGIDMPNVNTLIVVDADRFGLSQLYQLRGRVGRSEKFAYAYLLYKPYKSLTDVAVKRLNVIKEFTELGSGFSIATRDLSIRGAGDILGSEQAGFIDSVGIDFYLKILNEEINNKNDNDEIDEESNKPLISVTTHIDNKYISEDDLRIEIHRKINKIASREQIEEVKLEIKDRFGIDDENLVIYMYEEWFEKIAKKLGINSIRESKNSIEIKLPKELIDKLDMEDVFMDAFKISKMFRFISRGNNVYLLLDIIRLDRHPIYYLAEMFDKIDSKLRI